jgi:hypothetical protein
MHLHEKAPLFPVLKSGRGVTHRSPLNIMVKDSIDKNLMGSFSNPDQRALTLEAEPMHYNSGWQSYHSINFQVVSYGICEEPPKGGSREPGTTGRLYNDGPYIQSQVVSVSDLIMYKLTQANISSFVLYLEVFSVFIPKVSLRVSGHLSPLQVAILSCRLFAGSITMTCFKGCFSSLARFLFT